jgi:hypothetical protein
VLQALFPTRGKSIDIVLNGLYLIQNLESIGCFVMQNSNLKAAANLQQIISLFDELQWNEIITRQKTCILEDFWIFEELDSYLAELC